MGTEPLNDIDHRINLTKFLEDIGGCRKDIISRSTMLELQRGISAGYASKELVDVIGTESWPPFSFRDFFK